MPFSEKIKLEAKRNSAFRCCICYKRFVEVHHIIPQSEGGSNSLENAAPLCASCHDLFGGNPEKRKQIREMRDYWWQIISERKKNLSQRLNFEDYCIIEEREDPLEQLNSRTLVIYHNVMADDSFEKSAHILFKLLSHSIKKFKMKKRILFLDIEGHRNPKGGYDHDMFELQYHFIPNILFPYLSECHSPLFSVRNTKPQRKDIPKKLLISEDKEYNLSDMARQYDDFEIYLADNGKWVSTKRNKGTPL